MVKVKALAEISKKYADVTPNRAPYYKSGVSASDVDWAGPAAASEGAYEAGVQQAISEKRFGRGVREAGNEKFKRNASGKGAERYGPGVRAGVDDFKESFAPYHGVISGITLSARGARGDPGNYKRVQEIGDALHAERVGR